MFGLRPLRKLAVSENPRLLTPNSAAKPLFDDDDVDEEVKVEVDALFGDRC